MQLTIRQAVQVTDLEEIKRRMRALEEIAILPTGQTTTPHLAAMTGVRHTIAKPQRWF